MPMLRVRLIRAVVCLLALGICACSPSPPPPETPTSDVVGTTPPLLDCFQRAGAAAEREDWAAARDAVLEGIAIAPNVPALYLNAAGFEARLGDEAASRYHLEEAVRLGATADLATDEAFTTFIDTPEFRSLAEKLAAQPHESAEVVHRFDDVEMWPEGIARDPETGDLFVGSIGRRAIYRLGPDGAFEIFGTTPDDGLGEVLGLSVDADRRRLWAATGSGDYQEPIEGPPRTNELVAYDLETGELVARHPIPDDEIRLLNDVAVAPDGTAWATETLRGELYRVRPGSDLELFARFPDLIYLNGLVVAEGGDSVYIGDYSGLHLVSVDDGAIMPVAGPDMALGMVDGLSRSEHSLVIVQNSPRVNFRVVRVDLDDSGIRAEHLEVLPSGLPEGIIPYTCAVGDETVYVIAGADFGLMDTPEPPPAPAVVRFPLDL